MRYCRFLLLYALGMSCFISCGLFRYKATLQWCCRTYDCFFGLFWEFVGWGLRAENVNDLPVNDT